MMCKIRKEFIAIVFMIIVTVSVKKPSTWYYSIKQRNAPKIATVTDAASVGRRGVSF